MMSNWWTSVNTAIHFVGGSAILGDRNQKVTGLPQFRRRKRRLQGLRVWYSVHFGYYFYAARGAILVVKFFGVKWIGRKSRRTLKRIEPGSNPVCHPSICNSNKTKLSFAGTGSAKQVSADLPLLQHVHQKRNDQNIVLWLGTLRHGDFSAKTSLVLQIARKSSKTHNAQAKAQSSNPASGLTTFWIGAPSHSHR